MGRWAAALAAGVFCGALALEATLPLSPREALRGLVAAPGFNVELVAAEPHVVDPVAFAFDEHGRLYVVESRGYPDPLGGEPAGPPQGVIALLEDRDGDGYYETRTEFATGLTYPNGIQPWRGGVLVTCSPDVLFLRDTNGDGRADERRVVLTGFAATRTAQIRASHPTLGMDNWIYLTSGLNGGEVTAPDYPERPAVKFTRSDSRFRPDTFEFETAAGAGQFGLSFDDFGRRFITSNRDPVLHAVLPPHYLARNPHYAFADTVHQVSPVGEAARVRAISRSAVTADYIPRLMATPHTGTFTSACGLIIYRGTALGADANGNAFICEPAQNLVQRQTMRPDRASFVSTPVFSDGEFLASTDIWFRPVFLGSGPDGALYVADMYRREIDHPQYVPEEARGDLDFLGGNDRGRIYRVTAQGAAAQAPGALGGLETRELCRALASDNGWTRDTAHRLLLERRDPAAAAPLRELFASADFAPARAHALRLLDGIGQLSEQDLLAGLADPHPAVREHAVEMSELRLALSPALAEPILELAADSDARVRFQAALTLGELDTPEAAGALAAIARADGDDRWLRAAVFSSLRPERIGAFQRAFLEGRPGPSAPPVMRDLGSMLGASADREPSREFLATLLEGDVREGLAWKAAAVAGLAESRRRRGGRETEGQSALLELASGNEPADRALRESIDGLLRHASDLAVRSSAPLDDRLAAVGVMAFGSFDQVAPALLSLLGPREPDRLQTEAASAMAALPDERATDQLLVRERWAAYTPAVREAVLAAFFSNARHLPKLLDAVEAGVLMPWAINPARRRQLANHGQPAIRERAVRAFASLESEDRMAVYEQYKRVLTFPANPKAGKPVYQRACAACHVFAGEGGRVGPDLSGIRNQPAEAILLHTLVPNYEIVGGYQAFQIATADGRTIAGTIASETDTSITLRHSFGGEEVILRRDIRSMEAMETSLMPNELEKTMTEQELADLIAYLKSEI